MLVDERGHTVGALAKADTWRTMMGKAPFDRLQGYLDGLRRHGLPIDLRLVVRGEDSVEGGRRAMSGWLGTGGTADRPTAVAAMSDTIAIGVMEVVPR